MNTMFSRLYEWWNLLPFYGSDLKEFLKGYDALTGDYTGGSRYAITGIVMLAVAAGIYVIYYFILDRVRLQRRLHWFLFLLGCMLINFIAAFSISAEAVKTSFEQGLAIGYTDVIGFSVSVALWSMIFFVLFSASPYPRKLSTNCRHTPWKQ